jgi:hypothetical protein
MGKLIQFPERRQKTPELNKARCTELRAEFIETLEHLNAAETFEEKQDETDNLQRIVQEYQLMILEEENGRQLAASSKNESCREWRA